MQIYNGGSSQLDGTVSRFKDVAYSGTYRGDGKLLVAGTEDKYIKLFNPGTRSLLRTFKGHDGYVMSNYLPHKGRLSCVDNINIGFYVCEHIQFL